MKKKRSTKEPDVPVGSLFAPVIEAARGMIRGLTSTLSDGDPDSRDLRLERVAGMETILLLCQRAAAGHPLNPDTAVMGPLVSALSSPGSQRMRDARSPLPAAATLEERMARLERIVIHRLGPDPFEPRPSVKAPGPSPMAASRPMPRILETPTTAAKANGAATVRVPGTLGPCELKMLGVLAQRRGQVTTDAQLLLLSRYKRSGSTVGALARLRREGLIVGNGADNQITDAGLAEAGPVEKLPTSGPELIRLWVERLGAERAEGKILEAVCAWHPKGLSKEELLDSTGYQWSGSVVGALATLRKLKLVNKGWPMRASEVFFEEGARSR